MAQPVWLLVASLAGLVGVAVLRAAWSRDRRSQGMNLTGWSLILGGAACGAAFAGAWGIAVAALSPMAEAFVLLTVAAIVSKPPKVRSTTRREIAGADRAPMRLAARSLTFLLVAILAAVIGVGIATSSAALVLLGGAGKSDAYATALFVMPLVWSVLAFVLLMQPHRRGQTKILAIASIPAWPCLVIGMLS